MSIETELQNVVAAASALNQTVRGQIDQINATVGNAIANNDARTTNAINGMNATVNSYVANARGEYLLPPNLIANSFMTEVEEGIPVGYSYSGVQIEAVHPYTQAFEGPYIAERPATAVDDPNLATLANPFWYGVYWKGPRLGRGGLGDGWAGISNGHILKITATPDEGKGWTTVWMPMARAAATERVGFRGFLKIVQGSAAGFGTDSGYMGYGGTGHVVTKQQTDAAPQGWMFLDFVVGTSQVTQPLTSNFALGFSRSENIEAYLALPYAYIPAAAAPGIVLE